MTAYILNSLKWKVYNPLFRILETKHLNERWAAMESSTVFILQANIDNSTYLRVKGKYSDFHLEKWGK